MNLSKLRETVEERGAWHVAVHSVAESDMTWDRTATESFSPILCYVFLSCRAHRKESNWQGKSWVYLGLLATCSPYKRGRKWTIESIKKTRQEYAWMMEVTQRKSSLLRPQLLIQLHIQPIASQDKTITSGMIFCFTQDLSSLTRDWTRATAMKSWSPNHWTVREFPLSGMFNSH